MAKTNSNNRPSTYRAANRFSRKESFEIMHWISANETKLAGKAYSTALKLIEGGTGKKMLRDQLTRFLDDMGLSLNLGRQRSKRRQLERGEDRTVVLSEAVLEINEILEDLGSGLSAKIKQRVSQIRSRCKVSKLNLIAGSKEEDEDDEFDPFGGSYPGGLFGKEANQPTE